MPRNEKRDPHRPPETPAKPSAPESTKPDSPAASSGPGLLHWLTSGTARHATAMCKHVRKILNHQRDILTPKAIEEVEAAIQSVRAALAARADKAAIEKQMENLEKAANKWLKPYPNATFRENVEVLLVALTVAMGVRTFFLQPFKIPTGSMQPTLYGVKSENLINRPDVKIPGYFGRWYDWVRGKSYVHVVAKTDGELQEVGQPWPPVLFSIYQRLKIGNQWHTIWFPPDYGNIPLPAPGRADLRMGQVFHKGEDVVRLQVNAGDHLFVNRITYNFRPPERGEIIVFETHGIHRLPADQQETFYIKRLCGLGAETLALQPDYELIGAPGWGSTLVGHLVVNGKHLSKETPHFENLYSFSTAPRGAKQLQYQDDHYCGHALIGELAPNQTFSVRPAHYFAMGDNTMNSSDSRAWGDFPQEKVIGKSFLVYWPISDRFGWGQR